MYSFCGGGHNGYICDSYHKLGKSWEYPAFFYAMIQLAAVDKNRMKFTFLPIESNF